jgi:hypothetical protein
MTLLSAFMTSDTLDLPISSLRVSAMEFFITNKAASSATPRARRRLTSNDNR